MNDFLFIFGLSSVFTLIALAISFAVRRRRWGILVWLPTTIVIATSTWDVGTRILTNPGGFYPLGLIFNVVYLASDLAGLFLCWLARPPKASWRVPAVVPLLCFSAALLVADWLRSTTLFEIQWVDGEGRPLVGLNVKSDGIPEGSLRGKLDLTTDSQGKTSFRVKRNQYLVLQTTNRRQDLLQVNVRIQPQLEGPIAWYVSTGWRRTRLELSESRMLHLPMGRRVAYTIVVPSPAVLDPPALRGQIRTEMTSYRDQLPPYSGYGSLCRNISSIGLIPELMDIHRQDPKVRESVISGLASAAEALAGLDETCEHLAGKLRRPGADKDGESLFALAALGDWAAIPPEDRTNPTVALDKVRLKIAGHVRQLTDFALMEIPHDEKAIEILNQLGPLARPTTPKLVEFLLSHPPDQQGSLRWRGLFFAMQVRHSDVSLLENSENEWLRQCTRDVHDR